MKSGTKGYLLISRVDLRLNGRKSMWGIGEMLLATIGGSTTASHCWRARGRVYRPPRSEPKARGERGDDGELT
jgi:hypothetical protein